MTDSREQFEAVAADWYGMDPEVIALARMADGYNLPKLAQAWRWWQFARSGIVVELPGACTYFYSEGMERADLILYDCADAIRAAGLGVKHG